MHHAKPFGAALFLTNLLAAFSCVYVWIIEVFVIGGSMWAIVALLLLPLGCIFVAGAFFAWSKWYYVSLFFAISSALAVLLTFGVLIDALRAVSSQRPFPLQTDIFICIPLVVQALDLALIVRKLVQLKQLR
jgi:hypothetical protein